MSVSAFEQFLRSTAEKGEVINTLFEERLFGLAGVLRRIAGALEEEGVPWELVGGLAVLVHVEEANPEHATLTRYVDLMVRRQDLDRIKEAAARHGFCFRHVRGVDMLLYGDKDSAPSRMRLLFSRSPITPENKRLHGEKVMVIPVGDLVRMKLSSWRLKDQVHIQGMDAAGLITTDVEGGLTADLLARLQQVRAMD